MPVYFVLFVVSSVTAGMILYEEYNWGDATKCVGFFVGLAVTFFGVYLVGKKDLHSKQVREKLLGDQHAIEVSIAEYPDESANKIDDDTRHPLRFVVFSDQFFHFITISSLVSSVVQEYLSNRLGLMRAWDP